MLRQIETYCIFELIVDMDRFLSYIIGKLEKCITLVTIDKRGQNKKNGLITFIIAYGEIYSIDVS